MSTPDASIEGGQRRPVVLPAGTARRLSNQIGRAFHGTFEARTGLRTISRAIAQQLLVGGASQDAVAQAFEDCVLRHPARPSGEPRNVATGQDSVALVALVRDSVAGVVHDRGPRKTTAG